MSDLSSAIENDAARSLGVPAGTHPQELLSQFQDFLKRQTRRVQLKARPSVGGREICRAHTTAVDQLLRRYVEALAAFHQTQGIPPGPAWAMVAVGGYGRGELNPYSDVDVVLLLDGDRVNKAKLPPVVHDLAIQGRIWDFGFKVGCVTRTVPDCVEQANRDMQSKTALLEARLLLGDNALFQRLEKAVLAKCVKGREEDYIEARLADQAERHEKHGDSPFLQEPNVKNGCGGLRDFQSLVWMTFMKYRTRDLADLEARSLISGEDRRRLEEAYDFLLAVRNHLHYSACRAVDVLSREHQPRVGRAMGYPERSLNVRIQRFMGDYYRHAGAIFHRSRTLERRLALLPQPHAFPSLRRLLRQRRHNAAYVVDGFKVVDGEAHAPSARVFDDDPARLMRVFRFAQQRNLRLSPDLEHLIGQKLSLVDAKWRSGSHVREAFLAILNDRGNVAPYIRAMHELGVLGRFLPPFGRLTHHVQHEFYHLYTTDEHTLVCLRQLDRVSGATQPPFKAFAELLQHVERPFILYLALLLHDVGKAYDRPDHALEGSKIAVSVARRLHLDDAATELLQFLIRHHLLMATSSQRRDPDDPAEVALFVDKVGTAERLDLLTLHTFADSMGTSEKLWTSHKNSLLWTLYHQAHKRLVRPTETAGIVSRQKERLAEELEGRLPKSIARDEQDRHFASLPDRYFNLCTADEIAADLKLVHRFLEQQLDASANGLDPVTHWQHDQDRGYSELKVGTWDREGLFSRITGVLTAARLNILNAEVFTRDDNVALDTFLVTNATTAAPITPAVQRKVDHWLTAVIAGTEDVERLVAENPPPRSLLTRQPVANQIPTRVRFDNATHADRTVVEVETEDRVGLLHSLVRSFATMELDVHAARIATDRGAAIDTFYLSEKGGGQIVSPVRLDDIERGLKRAVSGI